ncbi:helix-turn-helix domain-containing protein [Streptomyces cocklensis]|uniref:Differentiation regulon n=1 Tax=Actinacidiphila cocklensis TaxID=887465 RepID=A0A9W4DWA6_9ACTN|nr:helix-turn-helix domain-containing protein [Actinacidiphila cocklensis]WSX79270.1 helix-turn-helix domain-containing protein [Streptomyces sp. NBC_00899]CAG6397567.1 putative differentiation regulon [Actinacidiphila cocklensis]
MTAETSQTLDRGLRVLKLLADTDHGLTVTELAAKLGVNRTVVYRLLATLEQHSLVRRDLGGRARVGLGVLGLAHQVHPLLREAALPALRSLAEDIGATAHLTLVDGSEALAVAVVEPTWTDYHVAYRTGFRHPLDRGAAGRAILAGRGMQPTPDGSRWERFADAHDGGDDLDGRDGGQDQPEDDRGSMARIGTASVATSLATDQVRYVLTHGELEAGASGAAAPLLGVPGVEGSVGVVMLSEAVPERVGPRVVEAATEVSDALR